MRPLPPPGGAASSFVEVRCQACNKLLFTRPEGLLASVAEIANRDAASGRGIVTKCRCNRLLEIILVGVAA